jgi:hypothetical protein
MDAFVNKRFLGKSDSHIMHNRISCRTGIVGVSAQEQEMVAVRGLISDFFDHFVNLCVGFIVPGHVLPAE